MLNAYLLSLNVDIYTVLVFDFAFDTLSHFLQ